MGRLILFTPDVQFSILVWDAAGWARDWLAARAAEGPVSISAHLALAALAVGMLLSLLRLIRGPGLPDRVVALDMVALLAAAAIAVYAILAGQPAFLRAATVLALINFLGTVAFAQYLERRFVHKQAAAQWKRSGNG